APAPYQERRRDNPRWRRIITGAGALSASIGSAPARGVKAWFVAFLLTRNDTYVHYILNSWYPPTEARHGQPEFVRSADADVHSRSATAARPFAVSGASARRFAADRRHAGEQGPGV